MPSSLLRAGIAAIRDRSLGAVVALAGGAVAQDDTLGPLSPLTPGWKIAYPGGWAISSITDVRRLLFWAAACVLLLVLLAVTNPTEASFRAHLTELAFRRHLAHIRSSDEPEAAVEGAGTTTNGTPLTSSNGNGSGSGSGADTPPIAPFRFANHVAITLRTPNLCYRSYFFLAVAFAAAPGPPAFLSDPLPAKTSKQSAPQPEPSLAYLGVLGHWLVLGQVPALLQWAWRVLRVGRRDKARKKSPVLDRAGVLEMRAVLPKDETPSPGRGPTLVPKLLFKNESHKDLADLLPLHSTPSPLLPTGPYGSESRSRRGSINTPTSPTSPDGSPAPEVTSPVLTALKTELAAAQNVLTELQAQLTTHDESVAAAQAHLQSTLDELRQRRKEDDAERQDLKSKSKTLEDQKRQAEGARRDSEKRLKAVEAVRDGVQAKITTVLSEIEELKGSMEGSEKHIKIVQDEGARRLIAARKTLDDKTRELADLEKEVVQLESTNDTLHQQVRDAEDKLKHAEAAAEEARKMAPEEEMMLMAAAYEAAASETYLHGQRQNQADSQWATQAAAYMAEAGFPHVDQSYTARPTQTASSGYGHLARPPTNTYRAPDKASGPMPPPINTAVANSTDKNLGDLSGFEGFGPGAARSLARPSTPRHNDDMQDQGSPSGPISSSFPDSWLPQGLVRSLEGDVTPLEGALRPLAITPINDEAIPLPAVHDDGSSPIDGDSGSDSGGDSPYWPHHQHSDPGHRRVAAPQNQRFFPNGTSGSSTTLPGGNSGSIGHMQSRRWFSGSPSSENVSSSFNMFGSNMSNMPGVGSSDSLPLPAFESAFAPSASEKRALKWPLLNKGRWSSNNNAMNGLEEITAGLQDRSGGAGGAFGASPPANGLSAEELFNRAPMSNSPPPPQQTGFGPWLSAHSHFGNSRGTANAGNAGNVGNGHPAQGPSGSAALRDDEDDAELQLPTERKPSFRFFSLRKGA